MSSKSLEASSSTYLRLKNERGHWNGQTHNPAIDNFDGERHQAMNELQKHLGQPNTSADEIQRLMGTPTKTLDKPDLVLDHEFRRMNDNYTYPSDAKIWIYEWRGNHDYVYFVISKDNKVIQSDWYFAYE
ncbi:unnamed protein product [Rotaria sp. Silwood1]|nr:unnamed protein product [Rotaria sp. Silwood1]CAF1204638.1 unnamed protein product [Rotaria sp. Silwood1]CAF1208424.1 unnamed protein product [Rotaria sp. Silwood1]CAF3440764.1 unnamed protein product [Rotaria sp. Silwood1]CAF3480770.1 unnamed protein product [Rotaria sp. Silwood1]